MVVLRNSKVLNGTSKKSEAPPIEVKNVSKIQKTTKTLVAKPMTTTTIKKSKVKLVPISDDDILNNVTNRFDRLCSSFDQFITADPTKSDQFKELTKSLYEFNQKTLKDIDLQNIVNKKKKKKKSTTDSMKPLNNLFVKGFDNEQIWQQLDIFNKPFIDNLVTEVSLIASSKTPLSLNVDCTKTKTKSKDSTKTILKKSILKSTKKQQEENDKINQKKVKFIKNDKLELEKKRKVDFFDLKEMESFLDSEDRKAMNDNDNRDGEENGEKQIDLENDIDYFGEIPSESEDEDSGEDDEEDIGNFNKKGAMYEDFFDVPKSLVDEDDREDVDDEIEEDDGEEYDEDDEDNDELDSRDIDDEELEMLKSSEDVDIDSKIMFDDDGDDDSEDSENDDEAKAKEAQYSLINEKLKALANKEATNVDDDLDKSEFEKSQIQLSQKIEKAERELLCPAGMRWQLSGETNAGIRPENSLLEEHLQFDSISKPPPMLTDETTVSIESIIKQRIKDQAYDDVERKNKPKEKPFEFRRRIMLESEKSKVGLAELYESEFVKQQQLKEKEQNPASGAQTGFMAAGEVEENETRVEIRRQIRSLFRKLDSLSSFHYTPKQPQPEVRILNNLPAITVEEATPDTVADMGLLAPEEVFSTRGKKVLQAKGERDSTDKLRARRIKKKKQSVKQRFNQQKTNNQSGSGGGNKKNKDNSSDSNGVLKKGLSSSTKFFERLQETKESGKVVMEQKRKKPKLSDIPNLAKKLKL